MSVVNVVHQCTSFNRVAPIDFCIFLVFSAFPPPPGLPRVVWFCGASVVVSVFDYRVFLLQILNKMCCKNKMKKVYKNDMVRRLDRHQHRCKKQKYDAGG